MLKSILVSKINIPKNIIIKINNAVILSANNALLLSLL
jgi:hypothetical protein